ncbi:putative phospholipase B-like 2 [Sycon ciliatum]|uniref:putative phospholipase B-like 2 n=1 Tax=Sycon ciliatum TaxID=27933 RepID=UPI0031F6E22A
MMEQALKAALFLLTLVGFWLDIHTTTRTASPTPCRSDQHGQTDDELAAVYGILDEIVPPSAYSIHVLRNLQLHSQLGDAHVAAASITRRSDGKLRLVSRSFSGDRVGWAVLKSTVHSTGWATLELHTNASYEDGAQAEAAGFLEGYLTSRLIWDSYRNLLKDYCNGRVQYCQRLFGYLALSLDWAEGKVRAATTKDDVIYWHQYRLITSQLRAMVEGYNAAARKLGFQRLRFAHFMLMSMNGDLITLEKVLRMPRTPCQTKRTALTSCSAMVKIAPGFADVLFGHTTWDSYSRMLRIYKQYDLRFKQDKRRAAGVIPGHRIAFPSYPMNLQSNDDFYTIGTGLAVMETTLPDDDSQLLLRVEPSTLLYYFRVQIANRLARSGADWARLFSRFNSGTYNNQWMVFDFSKFVRGRPLRPGALTVLEQQPGMVHSQDLTAHLNTERFWASYNRPYFGALMDSMKYLDDSAGEDELKFDLQQFNYTACVRGKIFARDQHKAVDLRSVFDLLRYNDFENDPLGKCRGKLGPTRCGTNAIAARADLTPFDVNAPVVPLRHGRMFGATDCKVTSVQMMTRQEAYVVSGPTHQQQPVFNWRLSGFEKPHGHPDKFDFRPGRMSWSAEDQH